MTVELDLANSVLHVIGMRIALPAALLLLAVPIMTRAAADSSRRTPVVIAVEKVSPTVANISTEQVLERQVNPFPGFRDPLFDDFFHDFFEPHRERYKQTSLGSGVVIRPDGYILTNQHVVLRGSQIKVTLADDREFAARLVGADADSDLAVLRVDSDKPLPFTAMGDSDDVMIGETVIAIGNPFGLSHTVTTGVISAVGRSLKTADQTYYDFIQTDASINPGNSGGPLLNLDGELIGINTAIYQKAQGIGFAIPINRARRIVADLISYGEVHVPWIGAIVQDLSPELATHFHVTPGKGVLVRGVESESPAVDAGIAPGDVITAIDGRDVRSVEEYDQRIRDHAEGSDIELTLTRDGVTLRQRVHARRFPLERADKLAWQLLGVQVTEARDVLRITRIRPGSSAARIGMEAGDFIVALAGTPLRNVDDLRRKIIEIRLAQSALVSIRRGQYLYQVNVPFSG
jgi:serine protease Do